MRYYFAFVGALLLAGRRPFAEREDDVLRRRDHHPNTQGALLLGMVPEGDGVGVADLLERAASGGVEVLYLLGPELLTRFPDQDLVRRALKGAGYVVLHDTHARPEHAEVHALFAVASVAESEGTFVNYAHRLQRIQRAFQPPGEAKSSLEVLGSLLERLGGGKRMASAREVFRAMAASVGGFDGLNLDRVGPLGVALRAPGASLAVAVASA